MFIDTSLVNYGGVIKTWPTLLDPPQIFRTKDLARIVMSELEIKLTAQEVNSSKSCIRLIEESTGADAQSTGIERTAEVPGIKATFPQQLALQKECDLRQLTNWCTGKVTFSDSFPYSARAYIVTREVEADIMTTCWGIWKKKLTEEYWENAYTAFHYFVFQSPHCFLLGRTTSHRRVP